MGEGKVFTFTVDSFDSSRDQPCIVRGQQWIVGDWCAGHHANGSMAAPFQELAVGFYLFFLIV